MRLAMGTPEWQEKLSGLPVLLKVWSAAPDNEELIEAVETLQKSSDS